MAQSILVVDDEKKIRDVVSLFLRSEGFEVYEAENGQQALDSVRTLNPDLVILDVMLPDMSGFEVCAALREISDVLIIFLTAMGDDDYQLYGYRVGCDDYIAKPFKASILALKAKRMLDKVKKEDRGTLRFHSIELDEEKHLCRVSGQSVSLTQLEFLLLAELLKKPGRVLSRDYLLSTLWGYNYSGDTRAVDTMVKKLRKKLGPAAEYIKTVVAVGYKLDDES